MDAPTTINDLPDDMLYEVFRLVLADKPQEGCSWPVLDTSLPPEGDHATLRCVCRRWRGIADWVKLSTSNILVNVSALDDAGAIRARQPAACKRLRLVRNPGGHSTCVSLAANGLFHGSPGLRRVLQSLVLETCCLPSIVRAVTPIASCTALTELYLLWRGHKNERVITPNLLAPLSALRNLEGLSFAQSPSETLPTSALMAPVPALPDAPRLTRLDLGMQGNFVPVGSDAALGRLRRLHFVHMAPVQELVDAEDPFLLRAAFDAGTWQPSRLTGLRESDVTFQQVRRDLRAPARPSGTRSRPGAEWAPLASQVTDLTVEIMSGGFKSPSTGIVAGLGALTALRRLRVHADFSNSTDEETRSSLLQPVSIDDVHAPHLTCLESKCVTWAASVAQFPNLVDLYLESITYYPPLELRSLVARSTLKRLELVNSNMSWPGLLNLAELFTGGEGWPVLEQLGLGNEVLEWDTTGLAGAPTAAEFEERARQLLPALVGVDI